MDYKFEPWLFFPQNKSEQSNSSYELKIKPMDFQNENARRKHNVDGGQMAANISNSDG